MCIKIKNIMLVCMMLIVLVSLSTVVASEIDDTNAIKNDGNLTVQTIVPDTVVDESNQDIMNDEQVSESNQGDVLSASSDEDVLGDAGTFAALNTKVSSGGNSIKLENNYTYSSSTDSNYRNGIVINNDLEIDGQGHTIDGMSNSKIFRITSGSKVVLKNIVFKNAYYSNNGNGGAIHATTSNVDLELINCTFESIRVPSNGAAVYLSSNSALNIVNSTFKSTGSYTSNNGGAVYLSSGCTVNVADSTFESYRAYSGGVFYVNNMCNVNVTNSTFKSKLWF